MDPFHRSLKDSAGGIGELPMFSEMCQMILCILKVKNHCFIIMFHNVCLSYFDLKIVWDYNSRSGGQYQPSDVAQF